MAITVTMIEEKEFKTKVRGYDPVEVDEFLDEICDEMIEMQGTIQTLRDQLKQKAAEYTASSFAPLPVAPLASASVPLPSLAPLPLHKGEEDEERLPADLIAAKKLLENRFHFCTFPKLKSICRKEQTLILPKCTRNLRKITIKCCRTAF